MVSGLIQSDGDGDLSRLGTVFKPSDRAEQALRLSGRVPLLFKLVECPKWLLGKPSTGIPFSDKNSSKSAY